MHDSTPDNSPTALTDAPRPRHPDHAPSSFNFARFTRYLPSGQQFGGFLKNLLWVAPLTLLIWVYAEREQTVTVQMPAFPIAFKTTALDRVVFLRFPQDHNVVVDLSGPRAKIDYVREQLLPKADGSAPIQFMIDSQIADGAQQPNAVSLLNNQPLFKNNGVTVKACQPPYFMVEIDRTEERQAHVQLTPAAEDRGRPNNVTLLGFEPNRVTIRAGSKALPLDTSNLVVYAKVGNRNELKTRTGKVDLSNIQLFLDPKDYKNVENVAIIPAAVRATFEVAPDMIEIKAVTIFKETPIDYHLPEVLAIETATSVTVTVYGPAEAIQQINNNPSIVRGRIAIPNTNLTGQTTGTSEVKFDLPPGCWLKTDAPIKEWKWEIINRPPK